MDNCIKKLKMYYNITVNVYSRTKDAQYKCNYIVYLVKKKKNYNRFSWTTRSKKKKKLTIDSKLHRYIIILLFFNNRNRILFIEEMKIAEPFAFKSFVGISIGVQNNNLILVHNHNVSTTYLIYHLGIQCELYSWP